MSVPAGGIRPNRQQQERDRIGLRDSCAACGRDGTVRDPLVLAGDGYRVHVSHVLSETGGGYYGFPFAAPGAAA